MPSFRECPYISLSLTVAAVRVACKKKREREIFYPNEPGKAEQRLLLFGKFIIIADVTQLECNGHPSDESSEFFSPSLFFSLENLPLTYAKMPSFNLRKMCRMRRYFFFYLFISFFGSDPPRANSRGEAESLTGGESVLDFGRANRTRRKKDPSLHPCSRNSEVIWIKASFIHTLSGHAQFSSLAFYNGHIRL
jgi:hypothetical protein